MKLCLIFLDTLYILQLLDPSLANTINYSNPMFVLQGTRLSLLRCKDSTKVHCLKPVLTPGCTFTVLHLLSNALSYLSACIFSDNSSDILFCC